MTYYKDRRGVTLTELMVATVIISIGILGFFGSFRFISRSLHISRSHTLATNLGQEKIETLKNLSYYDLLITTVSAVDNSVSPAVTYDTSNYPPETISIGGITFTRETFVALAQIDNDVISTVTYTFPDTGMKQIIVNVLWKDGGTVRKWTLTNLLENPNMNPLDSSLSGQVTYASSGNPLPSAAVSVEENPDWNTTTDTSGNYSFRVYHGSYTIHVSSAGFYDNVSSLQNVTQGSNVTVSAIPMTAIATGTVAGTAWYHPDLVISQVVVSTIQVGSSQSGTPFNNFVAQYVELFNPTTTMINIGPATGPAVKLGFGTSCPSNNSALCDDSTYGVPLVYTSTYVAAGHYYLIANTGTFVVNGAWVTPDAVYNDNANSYCSPAPANWNTSSSPPKKQLGTAGHGPSYWLKRGSTVIDAVGVSHPSNIPPNCEGSCIVIGDGSGGFPDGAEIVRISSPTSSLSAGDMSAYGHAYDAGYNPGDFIYGAILNSTIQFPPHNTGSGSFISVAGVPAVGAVVVSSDPYSGAAQVSAAYISSGSYSLLYASYSLVGVTTGTWQITIATSSYYNQYSPVTVAQNAVTRIPNASTTPSWPASGVYSAMLDTSAVTGFVKGQITDPYNIPISGIQVLGGGGSKTTGSNGGYFLTTATGTIEVIANPNNANTSYVQGLSFVTLASGQVYEQDFTLSKGGLVQGYLTTGTTPLPNYVVYAMIGGSQYGAGTSNSSGMFTIRNLSTGTYTIEPVLDIGQDSSPNSVTANLTTPGATVNVGTFTVSGALGTIAGSVTYNGTTLTTGALIIASTGTISSTPPTVVASSAPAQAPFYTVSSKADGSYSLPVRGGSTYNLGVYVPNISGSGTTVTTTFKSYSGIAVTPSATTPKDLSLP